MNEELQRRYNYKIKCETTPITDEIINQNIELLEKGEPLTFPLSILRKNSNFMIKYYRVQRKLHPTQNEIDYYSDYRRKYYQKHKNDPIVLDRIRKYRDRPEVKERMRHTTQQYQKAHPEIVNGYVKKYYYTHREKLLQKCKEYNERPDVKERKRKYNQQRYYENREKILQQYRETYKLKKRNKNENN